MKNVAENVVKFFEDFIETFFLEFEEVFEEEASGHVMVLK